MAEFTSGKMRARLGVKVIPGRKLVNQQGQNWKKAPQQQQQPRKIFDARQKLLKKTPQMDARQLLKQKTKFVDARIKIQNKKAQTERVVSSNPKSLGTNDVRIKINNSLAKKTDARGMIQARQQAKQPAPRITGPTGGPQVTVTGLGKPIQKLGTSGAQAGQNRGNIMRTINPLMNSNGHQQFMNNRQQQPMQQQSAGMFTRTIQNQPQFQPQNQWQFQAQQPHFHPQQHQFQAPQQQLQFSQPRGHQVQYFDEIGNGNMTITAQNTMAQQQYMHQPEMYEEPVYSYEEPQQMVPMHKPQHIPTVTGVRKRPAARRPTPVTMTTKTNYQPVMTAAPVSDIVSPLQGFRVQITNLHSVVSQDDIVELFGSVGAMKKARLVKAGVAEVVYVQRDHAIAAVKKYHMRELDGQPMHVIMTTKQPPVKQQSGAQSTPMRLGKTTPGLGGNIDAGILHKALFRTQTRDEPMTRPVSFTVKI